MAVKYEIDGNIFREVNVKFLVAYVNEYLITARAIQVDAAGNKSELVQLNDGRWFSHALPPPRRVATAKESIPPARIPQHVTDS